MKILLIALGALSSLSLIAHPVEDFLKSLNTKKEALNLCKKIHTKDQKSCTDRLIAAYSELVCTRNNIDHYGTSACHENATKVLGDDAPAAALKSEVDDLSADSKELICKRLKSILGNNFAVSKICARPLVIVTE